MLYSYNLVFSFDWAVPSGLFGGLWQAHFLWLLASLLC
jgi:hypothetical protein